MTQSRPVVLIVEDDQPLRQALATKLRADGLSVLEAQNGQEGLDVAVARKPDLILLDIVMPVMDGLTMVENLRLDNWGSTANVIVLSNNSDNENIAKAVGNKVYQYIIKSDRSLKQVSGDVRSRLEALSLL